MTDRKKKFIVTVKRTVLEYHEVTCEDLSQAIELARNGNSKMLESGWEGVRYSLPNLYNIPKRLQDGHSNTDF